MKLLLYIFTFLFCTIDLYAQKNKIINASINNPASYVNTYIGFKSANVQITAQKPWGMTSLGPNFSPRFKKDSSKYSIHGFGTTHLSGVGCGQFQTGITFIPTVGELVYSTEKNSSTFSKEISTPGYYENTLDKSGIVSKMSATDRTGIFKFVYPNSQANIIIDLSQKLSTSRTHWSSIRKISENEMEGYMTESAFCAEESGHELYFVIKFNKNISKFSLYKNGMQQNDILELKESNVAIGLSFETKKTDSVEAKIGISYTSVANAKANFESEISAKEFNTIKQDAINSWNEELGKIKVEGATNDDKTIFYTGLYHVLIHPNIISDVNGYYPAMNSRNIKKSTFTRYSTFSLWDTYRNVHSLLALVYPSRQLDMVRSMIGMHEDGGWLPKWEHASRETYNMNGDPAAIVIADSYLKGLKDIDTSLALKAVLRNASDIQGGNKLRPGLEKYIQYGYIPNDDKGIYHVWGSVATTQEYSFSDWAISRFAQAIGNNKIALEFNERSKSYQNVFDSVTGFFRPKLKNGKFLEPFNPQTSCGEYGPDVCWAGAPGFVEGTPWQYRFMIPHAQKDFIKLLGGEKKYINELNKFFDINQYRMSNEPDITYPFLFNYVKGEEWRTQKKVKEILRTYYNTTQTGISGDDDCGTMSAWAVYAMMGFYPICPASDEYAVFEPIFDKVTISFDNKFYSGTRFTIENQKPKKENQYLKSLTLNNKSLPSFFMNHPEITKGGVLIMK